MESWSVLISVGILLALLASGRFAPALLFTGWAGGFVLLGIVESGDLLASFANPALATLILLMLVSLALERSHLLDQLSERLLRGSERLALLRLMGTSALFSAFLNNTAVVASFLGAISRQRQVTSSRLLIPLSFASIFGGITTLIGTSTNLVVSSFAVSAGLPALEMFQFSLVGVPVALVCMLVLLFSARLLPSHRNDEQESTQEYFLAARVTRDSPLVGKSIEENRLRSLDGLFLLEIEREGHLISPVGPEEILHAGDLLAFTGEVHKVQTLQRFPGLELFGSRADDLLATNLVEVVVSNESELAGRTLQEVDFRTMFNAGVVGIRRGEKRLKEQLGRIPLRVGDSLLLAVGADFMQHRNLDRNFHVLSGSLQRPKLSDTQSALALSGFAAVVVAATIGVLPLFHGLLLMLGALLASKTLTVGELRRRFPFELLLLIGSALTIAKGLEDSGAALLVSNFIQSYANGFGIMGAFIGVYLITLLLTETVTNNAAAALAFPIAISTAQAFGADPLPFIMAVAFGASACFLIPFGYQTHLMVYSPGRYRMLDYIRTGLPVSVAYSAGVLVLVPLVFPF
ncbi:potassium transporter TrkA [Marinobacterium nitratireducens]|uniref:Potassium transporter TrkA n=1 Tax=Marinobacterium nitratireducens TaxID=518897 RepID=A0A918DQJ2_9GAMM|nr:SLC13 family permease [Marinobacterium nitratireducens]GGO79518.1 potassium transporter TrkA [Marinobacterium nitratireducens]